MFRVGHSLTRPSRPSPAAAQTKQIAPAIKGLKGTRLINQANVEPSYQPPKYVPWIYGFETERTPKSMRELLEGLSARQVLDTKQQPITEISENETVFNAIKLMNDQQVGSTLVVTREDKTEGKQFTGIFTERDYLRKIILKDRSSKDTKVKDVMTSPATTAASTKSLLDCCEVMTKSKFRHLPIVKSHPNEQANYGSDIALGVISSRDLIKYVIQAVEHANDIDLEVPINQVFDRLCRKSSGECYVESADSVLKALKIMEKHNVGAVFVYQATEMVGIFTERDYLTKVIMQGRSSKTTEVKDVMTSPVVSVAPTESTFNCLKTMLDNEFRNLPVVSLIGDSIDYVDEKNYVTLGLVTDMNVIEFVYKTIMGLYHRHHNL